MKNEIIKVVIKGIIALTTLGFASILGKSSLKKSREILDNNEKIEI